MTKCVKPLRRLNRLSAKSARPARPIGTLHLDDLVLLVAKCLSGFTHFVICPCGAGLVFPLPLGNIEVNYTKSLRSAPHDRVKAGRCRLTLSNPCRKRLEFSSCN